MGKPLRGLPRGTEIRKEECAPRRPVDIANCEGVLRAAKLPGTRSKNARRIAAATTFPSFLPSSLPSFLSFPFSFFPPTCSESSLRLFPFVQESQAFCSGKSKVAALPSFASFAEEGRIPFLSPRWGETDWSFQWPVESLITDDIDGI